MNFLVATAAPEFPWSDIIGPGSSALVAILLWVVGLVSFLAVSKIKNEYAAKAVGRFFTVLRQIVRHVYQSFVEPLQDVQGGKLTPEQKAQAREKAKEALLSYVGLDGLRQIAYILGFGSLDKKGVDIFIETAIEDMVVSEKNNGKESKTVNPSLPSGKK